MVKMPYPSRKIKSVSIILILVFLALTFIFSACSPASSGDTPRYYVPPPLTGTTWEMISDPEAVGWSAEKLSEAYDFSRTLQTAAVMIIYNGRVLYYWGEIRRKFFVHSIRKSFLSALYGIHVEEGTIDLSKTMGELGIDDLPPGLSELEKTATVQMLLQARSGIYHPAACEASSMAERRPERYSHAPGTFWYYNNWDFNALGTIFEQETGTTIFAEFKRRIADPIGMEDFQVSDGVYVSEPQSIHRCYHFRMTARDMARLGLLFLRNGSWQGTRIISPEWIEESTTSYSEAGTNMGYGYMWWVAINGGEIPGVFLNRAYFARGYGEHFIAVIPDMDLVIVHRVNTDLDHYVSASDCRLLMQMIIEAKIR